MFSSFADVCFTVKLKSTEIILLWPENPSHKKRKMVYGKFLCKPFSKTREALCSLSLFFFSAISLCSLSLQVQSGFLWVFWVQFSFSFRFCRSAGSVFFASSIRLPLGFLGSVFFFFSILQVRRLSFLFGSALCRSGFSFWWVTGCAVGQGCGFLIVDLSFLSGGHGLCGGVVSVPVGCGVGLGGWLAGRGGHFLWIPVVLGVGIFYWFVLCYSKHTM